MVRHPLMLVLIGLVVLFAVFFLLVPVLSLIFHLVLLAAIVWVVLSLFRFHRGHSRRSRES